MPFQITRLYLLVYVTHVTVTGRMETLAADAAISDTSVCVLVHMLCTGDCVVRGSCSFRCLNFQPFCFSCMRIRIAGKLKSALDY